MNLGKFDGKRVRIVTTDGEIFEGICCHNNREFNECEYGRNEESLDMPFFKFYKRDIAKAEILTDGGPFGGYSDRYGLLEKTAVLEGVIGMDEILTSEEDEHIYRLLLCIGDLLESGETGVLPPDDELLRLLESVPAPEDEKTARELSRVIELLKS